MRFDDMKEEDLLLVVWHQVITRRPLFVVVEVQAVVETRSVREIDNIPQIEAKFTLNVKNRTRGNTCYVFRHSIETIKGKCP